MSRFIITMFTLLSITFSAQAQGKKGKREDNKKNERRVTSYNNVSKFYYGIASYYADKFKGRETANGAKYNHDGHTAACNVLPLGTWIRVTNLRNNKSIVVKVNDRLHARNNRLVDLTKSGAEKLGYTSRGLARVKVEVLGRKKPK